MATPKDDVQAPSALSRFVTDADRLTPEAQRVLLALVQRLNDHEARLAALEP